MFWGTSFKWFYCGAPTSLRGRDIYSLSHLHLDTFLVSRIDVLVVVCMTMTRVKRWGFVMNYIIIFLIPPLSIIVGMWFIRFLSHQKRSQNLALQILGVISPLFAYSWIDNSYSFVSLVHGLLRFQFFSHRTHSTIFNDKQQSVVI